MNPKISIIVPVYNVENYLDECIQSIINQEFEEFELILINDGSTDKSGSICDNYALKDNRIRVFHKENEGPSIARNLGINMANGEYIGFVDSDDTINKKMYKKMYDLAKKSDLEMVVCGFKEIDYKTNKEMEFINPLYGVNKLEGSKIKKVVEDLLCDNKILGYASLCNKLYKREEIKRNNITFKNNIRIAEDLCFNIQFLLSIKKICSVNEALYEYRRINSNSIMNGENLKLKLQAREEMLNVFKESSISEEVYLKCLKCENSTTITTYIGLIKKIIFSNKPLIKKYRLINELINEQYFTNAIKIYDNKHLTLKTLSIAKIISSYLKIKGKRGLRWR